MHLLRSAFIFLAIAVQLVTSVVISDGSQLNKTSFDFVVAGGALSSPPEALSRH
jgi:hypothetical protein